MTLGAIEAAWSWAGLAPEKVLATNSFGNVIVRATDGRVWRICPEDLSCEVVAQSDRHYLELCRDSDFQRDWLMESLVHLAERELGPLTDGRCYCLKVPAVLGGAYDASNLGTNTIVELIGFSGDVARQLKSPVSTRGSTSLSKLEAPGSGRTPRRTSVLLFAGDRSQARSRRAHPGTRARRHVRLSSPLR